MHDFYVLQWLQICEGDIFSAEDLQQVSTNYHRALWHFWMAFPCNAIIHTSMAAIWVNCVGDGWLIFPEIFICRRDSLFMELKFYSAPIQGTLRRITAHQGIILLSVQRLNLASLCGCTSQWMSCWFGVCSPGLWPWGHWSSSIMSDTYFYSPVIRTRKENYHLSA